MVRLLRSVDGAPSDAGAPVDARDLNAVFRAFAPYVANIAARFLGHSHDVEDLVQDVFLDAHRGLKNLQKAGAVRAWLATVTVRKARRRLRRRMALRLLGVESPADPTTVIDPKASAESRAWIFAVYRVLDSVSPSARIAWIMHHMEGESLETVAEVCGCSRATAHRRVIEAQRALEEGFGDVST